MTTNILNLENDGWKTGEYPLFLGQELGLHDTINRPYPKLFDLYKELKSLDWAEDEVNLQQARMEFKTCDRVSYEVMIKTLSWQFELDSVASRSIISLFSPFISNSDLNQLMIRWSDSECLHATTYSEIVRQCIEDPDEVIREIINNDAITDRSSKITETFHELKMLGARYTLDKESAAPSKVRRVLLKSLVALYCLEGMEFMASFACTFALAERDLFLTVAALVQKIMIDETIHTRIDEAIIDILMADPQWKVEYEAIKDDIKEILDSIYEQEIAWGVYIFSEGRAVVGLTEKLLLEWVQFKAQVIYAKLGIETPFLHVDKNPLPWMDRWLDINSQQVAAQETDLTNYRLNSVIKDENIGDSFDFGKARSGVETSYIIYTTDTCPFCVKLKHFMESEGIVYEERYVEDTERDYLKDRGLTTVPQIFDIEGNYKGDCTSFIATYN